MSIALFRPILLPALLCLLGSPLSAQLSDWRVQGRFQFRATDLPGQGPDVLVRRARIWSEGRVHPKLRVRLQYEFKNPRLVHLYLGYDVTPNLELRFGQSFLPFIGDFTEGPWFLDTIDFSVGRVLFPAEERGAFVNGRKGELTYNLSIVRGSGSRPDENSWKDVFGYVRFPALTRRLTLGLAHYEGRAGPNGSLVPKRRSATDLIAEAHERLTLKAAYIRGLDDRISTDAAWFRAVVHASKEVDVVGEYDTITRGTLRGKWLDLGVNYKLPMANSDIKLHYRRFQRPRAFNEVKAELQLFLSYPWRWR